MSEEKLSLKLIMEYLYTTKFNSPVFPGRDKLKRLKQLDFLESVLPEEIINIDNHNCKWNESRYRSLIFNGKMDQDNCGLKDFKTDIIELIIKNPRIIDSQNKIMPTTQDEKKLIMLEKAKSFCSCGKAKTAIQKTLENNELEIKLIYNPNKIRPEIPEWCSVAFIEEPENISGYKELVFDVKATSSRATEIQIEIKPYEKKWMHFFKEIEVSDDWRTYKIELNEVETRTLERFEELCFVFKSECLLDDEDLTCGYEIRNIFFSK